MRNERTPRSLSAIICNHVFIKDVQKQYTHAHPTYTNTHTHIYFYKYKNKTVV